MTNELQISMCLEDEPDIAYPDSDQDVPEVDGFEMEPVYSEVQQALIAHFGNRDDVLVAGNSFIYYKMDGHPQRTWMDCFVAFGVDRDAIRRRGCYYTWKTGKAPDFVLEIRIPMVDRRPIGDSWQELHSALGVTEYWIFDTTAASEAGGVFAHRLIDGRYEEMTLTTQADGSVRGYSPTLDLSLSRKSDRLRLHDPTSDGCALNVTEQRAARLAVEAENRQLREQVRRLQSQNNLSA